MTETEISNEIITRLGLPFQTKNRYNIKCFNHPDKHPSMTITKSINETGPGYIKCWVCGFSMTLRNYYYEQTGRSINSDLQLGIFDFNKPKKKEPGFDLSTPPETNFKLEGQIVPAHYSEKGKQWLLSRGFNDNDSSKFNIQYVISGFTRNINNPTCKEDWTYLNKRIIIPIYEDHHIISIEARDTDGKEIYEKNLIARGLSLEDYPYKKVIYPKASSTNTLFRLDKLDTNKPLFVVEGIMDVISLQQSNEMENSTAIFHSIPTERQLYLLSKFKEIILIPNNDSPSYSGFYRIWEKMPNKVKILPVPSEVKDINDILQGKYRFRTINEIIKNGWLRKIKTPDMNLFSSRIEVNV